MNEKFSKLGFYPADILLPNKDVDMGGGAVVACDQFTSEPEYWERVERPWAMRRPPCASSCRRPT